MSMHTPDDEFLLLADEASSDDEANDANPNMHVAAVQHEAANGVRIQALKTKQNQQRAILRQHHSDLAVVKEQAASLTSQLSDVKAQLNTLDDVGQQQQLALARIETLEQKADEIQAYLSSYHHGNSLYQEAFSLYAADKHAKAFERFQQAAVAGVVHAKYYLAEYFFNGKAGQHDVNASFAHASEAAQANDGDAQFLLAKLYEAGEGCSADKAKALYWYQQAKANGVADADGAIILLTKFTKYKAPNAASSTLFKAPAAGDSTAIPSPTPQPSKQ